MRKLFFIILVMYFINSSASEAQVLDVTVKNIHNNKGQLCLAIFANEAEFKTEKPCWRGNVSKQHVVDHELHFQMGYRPGLFGLTIFDDEDSNGKMEYNFLGIPQEGCGLSNYIQQGITRPTLSDFDFDLKKGETTKVVVVMKYY